MSPITHFEVCAGFDFYGLPIQLGKRIPSLDEAKAKLKRYQYLPAYRGAFIVEVVSTCCEGEFPVPSSLDRPNDSLNERPDGARPQMTRQQLRLVPRSSERISANESPQAS
ncbi:MAG: hypothetical protein Q8L74_12980 [Nitrospirota bacterium]|nr:hypothetical protein [Nitrospirota bacterium]